jgi:MFS transporter, SHS family, sialic acid transporter
MPTLPPADPNPPLVDSNTPVSAIGARGKWMALIAALLGWLFDGFEMGMFPLVGQPALMELLPDAPPEAVSRWFGVIMAVFLVGAAAGGVLFGWLGDRIGRVRAMALSIFTYAVFTGLCGFATEPWHIAVLRFIASLGMGGEWSLGVALVTELWPDRNRAVLAGLIGAASNVGFLLVGVISLTLLSLLNHAEAWLLWTGLSEQSVDRLLSNQGWRLMMIIGAVPALLIFFIRLFVPESERWQHENRAGATSHWATRDLLGVLIGTAGALVVVYLWSPLVSHMGLRIGGTFLGVAIALVGFLYPVTRYLQRSEQAGASRPGELGMNLRRLLLGAALTGVALLGTWGALQWAPRWATQLEPDAARHAKEYTQICAAFGAIVGTFLAALVGGWIGRRITFVLLCLGAYGSALLLYTANASFGPAFLVSVTLAGALTASFYGWFPLYLPELFPTKVRATSQGFAFNFGRILAAIGTLQTATLIAYFDGSFPKAGSALSLIYILGIFIIWLGPETKGKPLPE